MSVRIAIEGCGHGTLHAIYEAVEQQCSAKGWDGVDLLIIGGDFQSIRNSYDLNALSVPTKYREIGDFHEYYSGVRRAPYLTIFVGGNHEASNYLFELYYGGWVAPNIYYLGAANVIRYGPLRIAGLSGIWKGYNYKKSHHERLPYNQDDIKSIYHVREVDVRKLLQVRSQVDIGISHDWPRGVEWAGNSAYLFSIKSHFEEDARNGTLGSVAARYVMDRLRPYYWFSAHLHCRFTATIHYGNVPARLGASVPTDSNETANPVSNTDEIDISMDDEPVARSNVTSDIPAQNEDEIDLGDDDGPNNVQHSHESLQASVVISKEPEENGISKEIRNQLPDSFKQTKRKRSLTPQPLPTGITNSTTEFLALDKCLPKRKFLELKEISLHEDQYVPPRPFKLEYDDEWLAITRVFASEHVFGDRTSMPNENLGEAHYRPLIEHELQWVRQHLGHHDGMIIPENFEQTAPPYDSAVGINPPEQPKEYTNNQTVEFSKMLEIPNPFDISEEERQERIDKGPPPSDRNHDGGGGRGFGRGGRGRWGGHSYGRGRGRFR